MKSIRSGLLALLVIANTLTSCNDDNGNRLITANNEVINLEEGEKNTPVNRVDKFTFSAYQRYFGNIGGYQSPLNKVFHSRTTHFYYGIPVNGNIQAMYDSFLVAWQGKVIASGISTDASHARAVVKDSVSFVLVELMNTPKKNILLGGAIGRDSAAIMNFYLQENLKGRISDEK